MILSATTARGSLRGFLVLMAMTMFASTTLALGPTPVPTPKRTTPANAPATPAPTPTWTSEALRGWNPQPQPGATTTGTLGPDVPPFWVRPGYKVTKVAEMIGIRFMAFDSSGTLFVSRPGAGDVLTFVPRGEKYEPIAAFVEGHRTIHGLDFHDGWLWMALSGKIIKGRDTNGDGKADEVVTVLDNLPKEGGHWQRAIVVTPSGFYTSIGDPSNIGDESQTDRSKIWKYSLDGKNRILWSSGIRNTEKLRLRPGTDELWGADQGSDWFGQPLGDAQNMQPITDWNPPEELNHYERGKFYGHPFIVGNKIPRYEFLKRPDIVQLADQTVPPALALGAHWSALGFTFLTSSHFGDDHRGDIFLACHGSWNRREAAGYRVERILFDKVTGRPVGSQMIVGTYDTQNKRHLARPVDCVEAPDGSVLFTSERTQTIFRISKE